MPQISITQLFEENREKLGLTWKSGTEGGDKKLIHETVSQTNQGLIGHLNFIHHNWIQVLSKVEADHLNQLDSKSLEDNIQRLAESGMSCIIAAGSVPIPEPLSALAISTKTPILCSERSSLEIMWRLRPYLWRVLAPTNSMHGVLLDVLGMGVMITGESGVGKSELALELVSRGHGLVADDVVELNRIAPETLEGHCPEILRDFLEVRGLGMLNIRIIFGETAVRRRKNLNLIVHLKKASSSDFNELERLPIENVNENIMGLNIRKVIIHVAAGRNLAVLVEAAVRNYVLQLRGINSTKDFLERHEQEMENKES
ncbi:MAG: HPr(Ser) kinase/phosphatase [Nitrosomonadaceae bacterium]|jgi:HPr kinase/phosphorylase|nr:HPr(Ser) kinase/phosphatase [Nitrosomonadaceae bacterium]